MDKSLYSRDYRLMLDRLRACREDAGITQIDLAERLQTTQSFISKCERGERRLDLLELRSWIETIGVSFPAFVAELDAALRSARASGRRTKSR